MNKKFSMHDDIVAQALVDACESIFVKKSAKISYVYWFTLVVALFTVLAAFGLSMYTMLMVIVMVYI